jgi:hypothetical protein
MRDEKGRLLPCSKDEDALHILLKCPETYRLREHLLIRKWFAANDELAYKKIKCTNNTELRDIVTCVVRCQWEKRIGNIQFVLRWTE